MYVPSLGTDLITPVLPQYATITPRILQQDARGRQTPPLVLYGAAQAGLVPKKKKTHEDATFKINNLAHCSMKILLHVFGLFRVYLVWRGSQKEHILKL